MRFFFPVVNVLRLFCLCLSRVVLVGMLRSLSGLEGGTIVDMLLYIYKGSICLLFCDFGGTPVIYTNNIHSFAY